MIEIKFAGHVRQGSAAGRVHHFLALDHGLRDKARRTISQAIHSRTDMSSIATYLKNDFARCNRLYYQVCERATEQDQGAAGSAMRDFCEALERHMQIEERIVFSAYEASNGGSASPTKALRGEHAQIRSALLRMRAALAQGSQQAFLLHADAVCLLLQQHVQGEHFKVLPLLERALGSSEALLRSMRQFELRSPAAAG
jgi:hemerythrin-like domain-containing protein